MNKTLKIVFVVLSVIVLSIGGYLYYKIPLNYDNGKYVLDINNKELSLIVASSTADLEKGLSDTDSLSENTAMFFVFNKEGKYGFWMKDMRFSIDIVWLNAFKKVVYIEKNVSPDTYPTVFFPPEDSLYVLELKPGFVEENNIAVGNVLNILKK